MISIGNDIVALDGVDPERAGNSRFYSKFITPTELAFYQGAAAEVMPFYSYVWLLWSVKESVYKYQKRLQPELVFSPAKITVQTLNIPSGNAYPGATTALNVDFSAPGLINGDVAIGADKLYFKSIVNNQFIASIVNDDTKRSNICWAVHHIQQTDHESQSQRVRALLLTRLRSLMPQSNFALQNSPVGYPLLLNKGVDTGMLISFAHHGHYVSFCFNQGW